MSNERRGPLPPTSLWVDIERQCRDVSPDRKHECTIERGHAGAHIAIDPIFGSPMAVWPEQRFVGDDAYKTAPLFRLGRKTKRTLYRLDRLDVALGEAHETLVGFLDEAHGETIVAMLNETSESRANGNREHTASEKEKKEHTASEKEKKA